MGEKKGGSQSGIKQGTAESLLTCQNWKGCTIFAMVTVEQNYVHKQSHHTLAWGELHPQYDQINIKIEILGCIPSAGASQVLGLGFLPSPYSAICDTSLPSKDNTKLFTLLYPNPFLFKWKNFKTNTTSPLKPFSIFHALI